MLGYKLSPVHHPPQTHAHSQQQCLPYGTSTCRSGDQSIWHCGSSCLHQTWIGAASRKCPPWQCELSRSKSSIWNLSSASSESLLAKAARVVATSHGSQPTPFSCLGYGAVSLVIQIWVIYILGDAMLALVPTPKSETINKTVQIVYLYTYNHYRNGGCMPC